MGEEGVCMECRSLREEACRANFKVPKFYQVLSSGFDKQLEIPKGFSNHLQKLPETVTLIGPSGKTWSVGLTTNETAVFLRRGWEGFMKENFLQEKDLLIFKYIGDSSFDVQMFDGESLCEKTASYSVRKCGHGDYYNGGSQRKRKNVESSSTAGLTSPQDGNGDTAPEKSPTNWMDKSRRKTTMARAVTGKMRGQINITPAHLSPSATDGDYNGGFQRKRKNGGSSSTAGLTSPQAGNGDASPEKSPTNCMDICRRKTTVTQAVTGKMRGQINITPAHLSPSATDGDYNGGFQRKRKNGGSSSTAGLTSPQAGNGDASPEKSPTNCMDICRRKTTVTQAVTGKMRGQINITPAHLSPSATDGDYNGGFQRKRKNGGSSSTAGLTSPQAGNGDASPEKSPTNCMDSCRRKTTVAQAVTGKMRGQINFTPAHLNPSATDEEIEIKPGTKLATDEEIEIKPGTDLATKRGLHNALQLARKAVTNEGFIVEMKASHVIRKFYLSIPFRWICRHLGSREEQDIIWRIRDKKWTTRLQYRKDKKNSGWIFWKCFCWSIRTNTTLKRKDK